MLFFFLLLLFSIVIMYMTEQHGWGREQKTELETEHLMNVEILQSFTLLSSQLDDLSIKRNCSRWEFYSRSGIVCQPTACECF